MSQILNIWIVWSLATNAEEPPPRIASACIQGATVSREGPPDVVSLLRIHLLRYVALSTQQLERVASLIRLRHIEKGAAVVAPGEVCAFEGLVARGCLRVYFSESDGSDRVLYFAPEGWWVADIESFLSDRPAFLAIDALEPTDLLLIDKPNLTVLKRQMPDAEHLLGLLAERTLVTLQRRLVGSLRKTATERYREFLGLYPGLDARIPQYHIAAYLGISAEFLSKLRKHALRTG